MLRSCFRMEVRPWGENGSAGRVLSLPALMLYGMFFVYPLLRGVGMSLTDWDGMGQANFVGLKNFIDFFSDERAMHDIKTTLLLRRGQCGAFEPSGAVLCAADEPRLPGAEHSAGNNLSPGHHKPADHGLYLVFPAAARPGIPLLRIPAARMADLIGNWVLTYPKSMLVLYW